MQTEVLDAVSLAQAIRSGQTSALAAMKASLQRANEQSVLGAILAIDRRMALEMAQQWDRTGRANSSAPFGGVPFLAKDLGNHAKGLKVTAGCRALAARVTAEAADSDLFARFRGAGLLPFGLTTVPEFGLCLTSEPPGGPTARNPWDVSLSPGGSSGGAAAAVAAGIVAIAHATDAAGSIRVPAACCGLVGLKPTRGVTPNGPAFGNHLMGLAGELVLARTLRDVAVALEVAGGHAKGPFPDPSIERESAAKPLRIGVVASAPGLADIGEDQLEAVKSAATTLEEAGHILVEIAADPFAEIAAAALQCAAGILSVSLAGWLHSLNIPDEEISLLSVAVASEGRRMPAMTLFEHATKMALISYKTWSFFDNADVLITPMLSGPPPSIGAFPTTESNALRHWKAIGALAPYAALANVAGMPALSVPHGKSSADLPVAVQLIGPMATDHRLLAIAEILEAHRPWSYPWTLAGA